VKKLLLIGETLTHEGIGGKFLRALQSEDIAEEWTSYVQYTSSAINYSPSMSTLRGKLFYRMFDKRSLEWWGFQRKLLKVIATYEPDLILVTGILPISSQVFTAARESGSYFVNYLTDDPWNPIHKRNSFIKNISKYDHIFSTKQNLRQRLKSHGASSTSWLPFAFEPMNHEPPENVRPDLYESPDLIFVGTGAKERVKWLTPLADIPQISRQIYGNNWKNIKVPNWDVAAPVTGKDYCSVLYHAKITLGILREANHDLSTMRSYEIGAIGACGLYQDTYEHRNLLQGYPDVGFFKTPNELRSRVMLLLQNAALRQDLRAIAAKAIRKSEHTYKARLKQILRIVAS
tara:strand:+ start:1558 stop:2595 length:1038 start_codon:yes stop_codon:yes gene_type:complete